MNLLELKGKPVVEMSSARKVGIVDDAYLDPNHQSISALRVRATKRGPEYLVSIDHVCTIGPKSVTIDHVDSLRFLDQTPELAKLTSLGSLLGRGVVTEGGRILGSIEGVEFDPTSHQVTAITYTSVPPAGPVGTRHTLNPRDIVASVPDIVTVSEAAQPAQAA
jgi:sporulation protein YlmC with PRC-barrel domain